MRTFAVAATVAAPADAAWDALATPSRWPEWGPSIRAVHCTDTVVRTGTTGRVRTTPGPSLSFVVTTVDPGRSWRWRVAGVAATGHRVDPLDAAHSRITFEVPCWAAPYAVVCRRALRRLTTLLEAPNE